MKRVHTEARKSNIKNKKNLTKHWAINNAKKSKGQAQASFFKEVARSILQRLLGTRGFSK